MNISFKNDPILKILALLSRKWNYEIITLLVENGDCRYSDFETSLSNISSKMLSQRLKELYDDKIITKVISSITPLDFKYRLSDTGALLKKLLIELGLTGTQIYRDDTVIGNAGYDDLKNYFSRIYSEND